MNSWVRCWCLGLLLFGATVVGAEGVDATRARGAIAIISALAEEHPTLGKSFPEVKLKDPRNRKERFDATSDRGQILVFLHPEDYQCRVAMPDINAMTVEARRRGLEVVCILTKVSRTATNEFIFDKGIVADVLRDQRRVLLEFFGEPELPFFVVTDADGEVVSASRDLPRLR